MELSLFFRDALHAVVDDVAVGVSFKVENGDFWSIVHNKSFSHCSNELLIVFDLGLGEAVDSEIDGCKILHVGIVSEYANIGSWA